MTERSQDQIRGVDIEAAELRGFTRSVADVEWLLLILVLLYLLVTRDAIPSRVVVISTIASFACFVLLFRYTNMLRRRERFRLSVETLAMVAFLTAILTQTGGDKSPLLNLYLLPIITAALTLGRQATVLVMLLVCGCYLLLFTLANGVDAISLPFASEALGTLAPFFLVALLTTLLAENIQVAKSQIQALSDQDELTAVYNIRAFTRLLNREHELAKRQESRYALIMVDINKLKSINDTYGHEAGNRAINLVADALLRITRSTDVVARYGGDQFIVFLAAADEHAAEEVAQRIRNVVFSTTLEVGVQMVRIGVSVGAAWYPEGGETVDAIVSAADKAMYKDKEYRRPPEGKITIQKL